MNRDFYSDSMLSKYIHIKLLQAQINGDFEQCCLCPRISPSRAPLFTSSHRIALALHSSHWHIFWAANVCKSVSSP